jgi:pyruvate/2-oxoglutarate dehydrogenase complex dihydrolipoamide acyltransferase (E2) component
MLGIRLPADVWKDVEPGTEALLDKWLVNEGDQVSAAQPVASVVLVKTTIEVTAPANGRIARIVVPREGTFGRDQDLAFLEPSG